MSNINNNGGEDALAMVDQVINQEEPKYREEIIELEDEMLQEQPNTIVEEEQAEDGNYHEKKEKIRDDDEDEPTTTTAAAEQHQEETTTTTPEEEVRSIQRREAIAEPTADNVRVSIEKSDISSSVVGAGDPKPIKIVIPLIAALLNVVYGVIFLILSLVELKLTFDFVKDYHEKYDKNEDFYEANGYLEDDQVSLFSGISIFCLVIAALLSLFGATCGAISSIMIWRREFFFDLLKTHKNYINTILVLSSLWLLCSIVSIVPFGGIYLVLDFAVQFGTGIGFDWWALVVVLIGAIFVGFAGLLLKRIWEFRSVYVKFGSL